MVGFVGHSRTTGHAPFITILILFMVLATQPAGAGPFDPPYMTMRMEPDHRQAHVDQSEGDLLEFQGTLDVTQGSLVTSTVMITLDVNTGWTSSADPSTFEVTGADSKAFWVTVIVPPGASADGICSVLVTATLSSTGFDPIVQTDAVEITVERYVHLSVDAAVTMDTVERGGTTTFECDITNRGNGAMTFWLTAESVKGLGVLLDEESISVPAGETRSVTASVTVGNDIPPGTYNFVINVEGETSANKPKVQDFVTYTVEVPSFTQEHRTSLYAIIVLVVLLVIVLLIIRRRREPTQTGEDGPDRDGAEPIPALIF